MEPKIKLAAYAAIKAALSPFAPVPETDLHDLLAALTVSVFRAGECFARAGSTSDRIGLVIRGLFRVYYLTADGTESICNFHSEGMFIGPYSAIVAKVPSVTYTEALEPAQVAWVPYRVLAERFALDAAWERLGRKIAERLYVEMVQREKNLLTLDAAARLAAFRAEHPGLVGRVSKSAIASYIGVRPETLSRLLRRES